MVNNMNTQKILFPVLVAMVMLAMVMPAVAYPIKGNTAAIDGARCIAARSAVIQDSGSFTLSAPFSTTKALPAAPSGRQEGFPAAVVPVRGLLGTALPEGYMDKNSSGGQGISVSSDREALIGRLAGRNVVPGSLASTVISGEGTVRLVDRNGGFYLIVTTTGENYLPENLPATMKVNGTRVVFQGIVRAHDPGAVTWGIPITLISVSISGDGSSDVGRVSGEGTIRFIELEGGFFGIVTTTGENYLPENLPAAMKVDGTRVRFEGIVRTRDSDTMMWGTPISLITVSIPAQGFSGAGTVRFIELEGGFFGIITPAGDNYLPLNLPEEFQVDGLQVAFTAREVPDAATIAMWGTPIRIETISRYGPQPGELGGSWSLVSLDGSPLIPGTTITASFSNGRVTGVAGCNQYFASYSTSGASLSIGNAGSTEMYCTSPEGVSEQETLYLSLLPKASSFALENERLVIRDSSKNSILVFASSLDDSPVTIIEYRRTGGFAGFDDHLVISSDGIATVTRKETPRQVRVLELTMRQLSAHLAAADFPSLDDRYPAPQEGADYFTYTLTYDGKTVVTEDTGIPPLLVPIINILNEIVESSAPDDVIPAFF
jgi:heat shock protein HslJ